MNSIYHFGDYIYTCVSFYELITNLFRIIFCSGIWSMFTMHVSFHFGLKLKTNPDAHEHGL